MAEKIKVDHKLTKEEFNGILQKKNATKQRKSSYIIAMYTITTAIMGYALSSENEWLFLLPYVVLFSFHRLIEKEKYESISYAAFLAVFSDDIYENYYEEIHTSLQKCYKLHKNGIKTNRLVTVSALHLGLVCTFCSLIMWGCNKVTIESEIDLNRLLRNVTITDVCLILCACILFVVLFFWCNNEKTAMQTRRSYIEQLCMDVEFISEFSDEEKFAPPIQNTTEKDMASKDEVKNISEVPLVINKLITE